MHRKYAWVGVALLLVLFAGELFVSVERQSLSWDEGDHIFAGYEAWRAADFGVNPEHPPLVKELAALPLLAMHLKAPSPKGLASFKDEAYFDGRDLIFENGGEAGAERIVLRARMAAALLSLLLALLVFLAGREMFGDAAGLFAMTLVVFEPNLIAHGAYVTTDMGVSCFLFASIYAFYRYSKAPTAGRLLLLGVAAGLTLAAKHSGVLLAPIAAAIAAIEIAWPGSVTRKTMTLRMALAFVAGTVVAVPVLWATYGFRYSARPGGGHMEPSLAEYAKPLHGVEPWIYVHLAKGRLLPESYLFGLVDIRRLSTLSQSFPTYIFGQVQAHGVAYYFPAAFVIKSTLAFLVLILVVIFAVVTGRLRARREVVFLTVPPLVYLLIATATGLNIGARHILPMYAFLAVLIGGAVSALARADRRWAYAVGVLLAWHAVSSMRAFPVTLAYSNELWGGPSQTYRYLTDSNVDWGQQLLDVKRYLDKRGVKDCWFGYFATPVIRPSDYGIPCKLLPTADSLWMHTQIDAPPQVQGTVLVSVGTLSGYEFGSGVLSPYQPFVHAHPTAVIDDGVFVYDGSFDTRFAAALGHVQRAKTLAAAKQPDAALAEAKEAVAVDADSLQAEVILGDLSLARGSKVEAQTAYAKAMGIVKTMEPSARQDWAPVIAKKLDASLK
jgi:4-amino-4-deoxy-L-arabinose transferase-like glycosyltransferase